MRELRRLSDQFGINGVPRLVQLAMQHGLEGNIKNLYKVAEEALETKGDQQVLRPRAAVENTVEVKQFYWLYAVKYVFRLVVSAPENFNRDGHVPLAHLSVVEKFSAPLCIHPALCRWIVVP